jgi:PAS domain S-box-containing protein
VNEYGRRAGERVLDELPFGIWVGRPSTGEVLYTNQAYLEIMGVTPDSVDTPAVYDRQGKLCTAEDLPFRRVLASGKAVIVDDLVVHRRDGGRTWVRAFGNPVRDEQGVVSHVVVAFTDITAEVRAVVQRAEVEKHLSIAIHHAPVLFFMMDRNAVLTAADGALRPILEQGRRGMVGTSLFDAYKDNPTVVENVRRALAGETVSYSVEVQSLILDVWLGPLRDAGGDLAGAIGVCTDVSEVRRLQTRIIQDDRVRAMGTMAASVAHEINNPLTYVLANLEAARLELGNLSTDLGALMPNPDVAPAKAAMARIDRLVEFVNPALAGAGRIRQITRELSTFTRSDDERLMPIDVATVVRSVLKLVRKEIEARARLVEELDVSSVVLGNEARLVQVLVNLLMNAWQALPVLDPAHHVIGVRSGIQDGNALIEIWDSGPGVPMQLRDRIFEPFVTTKDVGMGTGLGLFVCRNIIHALHGYITVHDAPSGGALFRVVLPSTQQPALASAPASSVSPEPTAQDRRPRILIIDDDAMVAMALASRFEKDRFEVRTVLDGRQGLDIILADDLLDLAYCDVMMSDFTGIDLYEALARQSPERLSKLVFMTGGAFTDRARAFLDQRRDTCVRKPFDILADAQRRVG